MARPAAVGLASLVAVVSIFAAALLASFPAARACSVRHEIHAMRACVPFVLFLASGGWAMWAGGRSHRLFVFLGTALVTAGYVAMLSITVPAAIRAELQCAKPGLTVRR